MKTFKIGEKYIVTSDGRVFTYWENHKKWKEQKYRRHTNGYLRVTIFGKDEYVHRLVAQCFIGQKDSDNELSYSKPVALCAKYIQLYSKQFVVDLFGGSGSTLIACEQLGRTCFMCEFDPKYVDVIIERWEKFTGGKAERV